MRHWRPTLRAPGIEPREHSCTTVFFGIFNNTPSSLGVSTSSRDDIGYDRRPSFERIRVAARGQPDANTTLG